MTTLTAGDEVPLKFKYSAAGRQSEFTMSVKVEEDVGVNALFTNENATHGFTLNFRGIHGEVNVSPVSLIQPGTPISVQQGQKDWWIQTSSQNMEGFFIQTGAVDTQTLGIDNIDVSTRAGAEDAIDRVYKATLTLTDEKARIGAQENRLEHAVMVTSNTSENTSAAESRIRDEDMADALVEYFKQNVIENVGQSILAQANQSKDGIMTLLQA